MLTMLLIFLSLRSVGGALHTLLTYHFFKHTLGNPGLTWLTCPQFFAFFEKNVLKTKEMLTQLIIFPVF